MLLTLESVVAMEMQQRLSEQNWHLREGSSPCTLSMEAAGSNRNVGALDRHSCVTRVLMKFQVCCVREKVVTDVSKARILRNVCKNLPKDTVSHRREVLAQRHSVTS
jgi:hypothetical protein